MTHIRRLSGGIEMRMSLTKATRWIAKNDEPALSDPVEIENQITVQLIADLSGWSPRHIAKLVLMHRRRMKNQR